MRKQGNDMEEVIFKKSAMKILEAALPTVIDEDSGEYVLGINVAYGLISSIPPIRKEILEDIISGKRTGCLSIEQLEDALSNE